MQIVLVRFNESPMNYSFKATNNIHEGDLVVVDTRYGLRIAEVIEENVERTVVPPTKWVVQKIDISSWEENKRKEERRQELLKKMEERKNIILSEQLLKKLSEQDSVMKELYDEFNSLNIPN